MKKHYFTHIVMVMVIACTVIFSSCGKEEKGSGGQPGNAPGGEKESSIQKAEPIIIATEQKMQEIFASNEIVLVDFYSDLCPPCKQLKPTIHEIAGEYRGKIAVGAVNVQNASELAKKYGVNPIPDVRIFRNGTQEKKIIGLRKKEEYTEAIDSLLNE